MKCRLHGFSYRLMHLFLQIVSGRYGQATSVLHHLIGNVMGFASLLRESWMFTSAVARMRTLYGVQASERQAVFLQTQEGHTGT